MIKCFVFTTPQPGRVGVSILSSMLSNHDKVVNLGEIFIPGIFQPCLCGSEVQFICVNFDIRTI